MTTVQVDDCDESTNMTQMTTVQADDCGEGTNMT